MKKKLMAIDDEKSIRFILESTFKSDYDIISWDNGLDALNDLQSGNLPDLIICDIEMPQMDGFEFITQVRASGFFDDIPLIMLSGKEDSKDKVRCFETGADDYLLKPFNPKELKARISRRLKSRDMFLERFGN
ncbi:MAG: two-component system response regulator [Bacteroidetes bacterium CG2_30_33_31]|nr:MAG: two-component system response regulator [Bacteroidetes bacterium CG2_30_33_31]